MSMSDSPTARRAAGAPSASIPVAAYGNVARTALACARTLDDALPRRAALQPPLLLHIRLYT